MVRFYLFIFWAFVFFAFYNVGKMQVKSYSNIKIMRYEAANNDIEHLIFIKKLMEVDGKVSSLNHRVYVSDLLRYSEKSPDSFYNMIVRNDLEDYSKRFFMDGKINFNEMLHIQSKIQMEIEKIKLERGIMPSGDFDYKSKI